MNRRSFLQLLGLAPVAASMPAVATPIPVTPRNCIGLPEVSFRSVNADLLAGNPLTDEMLEGYVPTLADWHGLERKGYEDAPGVWPEWTT